MGFGHFLFFLLLLFPSLFSLLPYGLYSTSSRNKPSSAGAASSIYKINVRIPGKNITKVFTSTSSDADVVFGQETVFVATQDDELYAWGSNFYSQLCVGYSSAQVSTPTNLNKFSGIPISQVAVNQHTLILLQNGTLFACGGNLNYRAGLPTNGASYPNPELISPSLFSDVVVSVAVGDYHSAALTADGNLYMAGTNAATMFVSGDTFTLQRSGIIQIAAANSYTLYLSRDGVVSIKGPYPGGQTSMEFSGEKMAKIVAGHYGFLMISTSNKLYTFGKNDKGQAGIGRLSAQLVPNPVAGDLTGRQVETVAIGLEHVIARADKILYGFGSNAYGQLVPSASFGHLAALPTKLSIEGLSTYSTVFAGKTYSGVLHDDGSITMWGNHNMAFPSGTLASILPVNLLEDGSIASVSAGFDRTYVVTRTGDVYYFGACPVVPRITNCIMAAAALPIKLVLSFTVQSVAASNAHALYLTTTGTVYVTGPASTNGLLGLGSSNAEQITPVQIPTLSGIRYISTGFDRSFAVAQNGSIYGWGKNVMGTLCLSLAATFYGTPRLIGSFGDNVIKIAFGDLFTLFLLRDGTLQGCGDASKLAVPVVASPYVTQPTNIYTSAKYSDVAAAKDNFALLTPGHYVYKVQLGIMNLVMQDNWYPGYPPQAIGASNDNYRVIFSDGSARWSLFPPDSFAKIDELPKVPGMTYTSAHMTPPGVTTQELYFVAPTCYGIYGADPLACAQKGRCVDTDQCVCPTAPPGCSYQLDCSILDCNNVTVSRISPLTNLLPSGTNSVVRMEVTFTLPQQASRPTCIDTVSGVEYGATILQPSTILCSNVGYNTGVISLSFTLFGKRIKTNNTVVMFSTPPLQLGYTPYTERSTVQSLPRNFSFAVENPFGDYPAFFQYLYCSISTITLMITYHDKNTIRCESQRGEIYFTATRYSAEILPTQTAFTISNRIEFLRMPPAFLDDFDAFVWTGSTVTTAYTWDLTTFVAIDEDPLYCSVQVNGRTVLVKPSFTTKVIGGGGPQISQTDDPIPIIPTQTVQLVVCTIPTNESFISDLKLQLYSGSVYGYADVANSVKIAAVQQIMPSSYYPTVVQNYAAATRTLIMVSSELSQFNNTIMNYKCKFSTTLIQATFTCSVDRNCTISCEIPVSTFTESTAIVEVHADVSGYIYTPRKISQVAIEVWGQYTVQSYTPKITTEILSNSYITTIVLDRALRNSSYVYCHSNGVYSTPVINGNRVDCPLGYTVIPSANSSKLVQIDLVYVHPELNFTIASVDTEVFSSNTSFSRSVITRENSTLEFSLTKLQRSTSGIYALQYQNEETRATYQLACQVSNAITCSFETVFTFDTMRPNIGTTKLIHKPSGESVAFSQRYLLHAPVTFDRALFMMDRLDYSRISPPVNLYTSVLSSHKLSQSGLISYFCKVSLNASTVLNQITYMGSDKRTIACNVSNVAVSDDALLTSEVVYSYDSNLYSLSELSHQLVLSTITSSSQVFEFYESFRTFTVSSSSWNKLDVVYPPDTTYAAKLSIDSSISGCPPVNMSCSSNNPLQFACNKVEFTTPACMLGIDSVFYVPQLSMSIVQGGVEHRTTVRSPTIIYKRTNIQSFTPIACLRNLPCDMTIQLLPASVSSNYNSSLYYFVCSTNSGNYNAVQSGSTFKCTLPPTTDPASAVDIRLSIILDEFSTMAPFTTPGTKSAFVLDRQMIQFAVLGTNTTIQDAQTMVDTSVTLESKLPDAVYPFLKCVYTQESGIVVPQAAIITTTYTIDGAKTGITCSSLANAMEGIVNLTIWYMQDTTSFQLSSNSLQQVFVRPGKMEKVVPSFLRVGFNVTMTIRTNFNTSAIYPSGTKYYCHAANGTVVTIPANSTTTGVFTCLVHYESEGTVSFNISMSIPGYTSKIVIPSFSVSIIDAAALEPSYGNHLGGEYVIINYYAGDARSVTVNGLQGVSFDCVEAGEASLKCRTPRLEPFRSYDLTFDGKAMYTKFVTFKEVAISEVTPNAMPTHATSVTLNMTLSSNISSFHGGSFFLTIDEQLITGSIAVSASSTTALVKQIDPRAIQGVDVFNAHKLKIGFTHPDLYLFETAPLKNNLITITPNDSYCYILKDKKGGIPGISLQHPTAGIVTHGANVQVVIAIATVLTAAQEPRVLCEAVSQNGNKRRRVAATFIARDLLNQYSNYTCTIPQDYIDTLPSWSYFDLSLVYASNDAYDGEFQISTFKAPMLLVNQLVLDSISPQISVDPSQLVQLSVTSITDAALALPFIKFGCVQHQQQNGSPAYITNTLALECMLNKTNSHYIDQVEIWAEYSFKGPDSLPSYAYKVKLSVSPINFTFSDTLVFNTIQPFGAVIKTNGGPYFLSKSIQTSTDKRLLLSGGLSCSLLESPSLLIPAKYLDGNTFACQFNYTVASYKTLQTLSFDLMVSLTNGNNLRISKQPISYLLVDESFLAFVDVPAITPVNQLLTRQLVYNATIPLLDRVSYSTTFGYKPGSQTAPMSCTYRTGESPVCHFPSFEFTTVALVRTLSFNFSVCYDTTQCLQVSVKPILGFHNTTAQKVVPPVINIINNVFTIYGSFQEYADTKLPLDCILRVNGAQESSTAQVGAGFLRCSFSRSLEMASSLQDKIRLQLLIDKLPFLDPEMQIAYDIPALSQHVIPFGQLATTIGFVVPAPSHFRFDLHGYDSMLKQSIAISRCDAVDLDGRQTKLSCLPSADLETTLRDYQLLNSTGLHVWSTTLMLLIDGVVSLKMSPQAAFYKSAAAFFNCLNSESSVQITPLRFDSNAMVSSVTIQQCLTAKLPLSIMNNIQIRYTFANGVNDTKPCKAYPLDDSNHPSMSRLSCGAPTVQLGGAVTTQRAIKTYISFNGVHFEPLRTLSIFNSSKIELTAFTVTAEVVYPGLTYNVTIEGSGFIPQAHLSLHVLNAKLQFYISEVQIATTKVTFKVMFNPDDDLPLPAVLLVGISFDEGYIIADSNLLRLELSPVPRLDISPTNHQERKKSSDGMTLTGLPADYLSTADSYKRYTIRLIASVDANYAIVLQTPSNNKWCNWSESLIFCPEIDYPAVPADQEVSGLFSSDGTFFYTLDFQIDGLSIAAIKLKSDFVLYKNPMTFGQVLHQPVFVGYPSTFSVPVTALADLRTFAVYPYDSNSGLRLHPNSYLYKLLDYNENAVRFSLTISTNWQQLPFISRRSANYKSITLNYSLNAGVLEEELTEFNIFQAPSAVALQNIEEDYNPTLYTFQSNPLQIQLRNAEVFSTGEYQLSDVRIYLTVGAFSDTPILLSFKNGVSAELDPQKQVLLLEVPALQTIPLFSQYQPKLKFPLSAKAQILLNDFPIVSTVTVALLNATRQPVLLRPDFNSMPRTPTNVTIRGIAIADIRHCSIVFGTSGNETTQHHAFRAIQDKEAITNKNEVVCEISWIPSNATELDVFVITNTTGVQSNGVRIYIFDEPTIAGVSPLNGPMKGSSVTLLVNNLDLRLAASVILRFGKIESPPCTFLNNATGLENTYMFTCTAPRQQSGAVDLSMSYNRIDWYFYNRQYTYDVCMPGYGVPIAADPDSEEAYTCAKCPPGHYQPGKVPSCIACPQNYYSDTFGSATCEACPENSITTEEAGPSVFACKCDHKFMVNFDKKALFQDVKRNYCIRCPKGGICNALNTTLPTAAKGFWYQNKTNIMYTFYVCSPEEACPGGSFETCKKGFEGPRCGRCADGFFKWRGDCLRCEDGAWWRFLIAVVILALIVVLVLGFTSIRVAHVSALSIALSFWQVLSMLQNFPQVKWPGVVDNGITLASAANFNPDFLSPGCFLPKIPYAVKWGLSISLPIPILLLLILAFILHLIRHVIALKLGRMLIFEKLKLKYKSFYETTAIAQQQHKGVKAWCLKKLGSMKLSIQNMVITLYNSTLFLLGQPLTKEQMEIFKNRLINGYCTFISISFTFMMTTASEVFACSKQPDGSRSMKASPDILCNSPLSQEWYTLLPIAIVFYVILLSVIGGFFIYAFFKRHLLQKHTLASKKGGDVATDLKLNAMHFRERFRFVLTKFKTKYYFWDFIILLRKSLLSICYIVFDGMLVIVSAIAIVFVGLILHMMAAPYKQKFHNIMEYIVLIATLMTLMCGLLFFVDQFPTNGFKDFVIIMSILLMVVSTILVFGMALWDVRTRKVKSSSRSRKKGKSLKTTRDEQGQVQFVLFIYKAGSADDDLEEEEYTFNQLFEQAFAARRFKKLWLQVKQKVTNLMAKCRKVAAKKSIKEGIE